MTTYPLSSLVTGTPTPTGTMDAADVVGLQALLDAKVDDSQATATGLAVLGAASQAAGRSALALGTAATANVGSGNGLDADLLDGQHGAYYLDLAHATGTADVARIPTGTAADKVVKLDGSARLPAVDGSQLTNLPSDVLPFANLAAFPAPGIVGKIYIANDSGLGHRWNGSAYAVLGGDMTARGYDAAAYGVSTANANNATAINTAVADIVSRGGGTLILPPGNLAITSQIVLATGVVLAGHGTDITNLVLPNIATLGAGLGAVPITAQDKVTFGLRDFTLIGNRAAWGASPPALSPYAGVSIGGGSRFSIMRVGLRRIEGDAIFLTRTGLTGGCNEFVVADCIIDGAATGINIFKGAFNGTVERNGITNIDGNGIQIDDATSSDVLASSFPCQFISVVTNKIATFSKVGGSGAGILASGLQGGVIGFNTIRSGGVSGTSAAMGIVINSGQSQFNRSTDLACVGNNIFAISGGAGIRLSGAQRCSVVGNTLSGLNTWPSALSGVAIDLLDDGVGGTQHNMVSSNVIEGNTNTTIGIRIGSATTLNQVGHNAITGLATPYSVTAGATHGQILDLGIVDALPTWNAGLRGARVFVRSNDKFYVATSVGWDIVGTQS
jgi:hypothetical protein